MATVEKEANDLLATVYRIGERKFEAVKTWNDSSYSDKRAACFEIVRAARVLLRGSLARCNGIERYDEKAKMRLASWTDADEARTDTADKKAEARVLAAFAVIYGAEQMQTLSVEFQGDPRGSMVKLYADQVSRDRGGNPLLWV